jgi:signal transduction histidine kinase
MGPLAKLRAFFEVPIRYFWVALLVPTLYAGKYAFGDFDPGRDDDYFVAWIMVFVPFVLMIVPIQLTYAHLPERLRPSDPGSLRAVPFHAVVLLGWVLLGAAVGEALISPLFPPIERDPTNEWREIPGIVSLITLFGTPFALRSIYNRQRLEQLRTRELRAQREALAAQVQALQARIEPHFLFNSLNSVASLIGQDAERAERALEKISDLFRYALDASNQPLVPLAQELRCVESCLELETLRFPDRLNASLRVEPGVGEVPVPPLFLQPLVENAVQHGVAPRPEGGRVELEIRREADQLHVRVEDDGPGPGGSKNGGAGVALADLRKRLALLYAGKASLEVDRGTLGGCRVTLGLPLGGAVEREAEV